MIEKKLSFQVLIPTRLTAFQNTPDGRRFTRAGQLLSGGRFKEARKILEVLAKRKGPFQAQARALLLRLYVREQKATIPNKEGKVFNILESKGSAVREELLRRMAQQIRRRMGQIESLQIQSLRMESRKIEWRQTQAPAPRHGARRAAKPAAKPGARAAKTDVIRRTPHLDLAQSP